ncbi:MAG: anthranilate synthase component I [Alphaproteobacteria bacterium]|nr:anthranilate synthase component I [Alphaproteobacteria bacterium]
MLSSTDYLTDAGIEVNRQCQDLRFPIDLTEIAQSLDKQRGLLLSSSYEVVGRYNRWSLAAVNPPIVLSFYGAKFSLEALNPRGEILLPLLASFLRPLSSLENFAATPRCLSGEIPAAPSLVDESQRGKRPSVFSVLRAIQSVFASRLDANLGLYGAFGYDLVFQFDPMELVKPRPHDQRDLVLYLPDELTLIDNRKETAARLSYEFSYQLYGVHYSTRGVSREAFAPAMPPPPQQTETADDLPPGGYAAIVREAFGKFHCGDLFEVVPSHRFVEQTAASPSALFQHLTQLNPSPYGFLFNLGRGEYLIGASPEMFVRVAGKRVETCPISGTIKRGRNAMEDADQILTLLNSTKDETELTMCTDVDRNDKARVCVPGSVQVIGRRQIELYSHLIHTVDHVEGQLAAGFDALDAFLSHMWAVTVTGAPKRAAIGFIESHEPGTRRWYGGAVGRLGFDGNMETGLTLRTMRYSQNGVEPGGVIEIRAGATLLAGSDPEAEEAETILKAAALRQTIRTVNRQRLCGESQPSPAVQTGFGTGKRILMMDCEDSFVHNLASYFRATGAAVTVIRHREAFAALDAGGFEMVILSPGPGRPAEFRVPEMVAAVMERRLPLFGVCLGLQGIVEALGGKLGILSTPQHGRRSLVRRTNRESRLLHGLGAEFFVGRYHSLYAEEASLPPELVITARSDDGVIMAIEHQSLPIAAVQFHPESIMTVADNAGQIIVNNLVQFLTQTPQLQGRK